MTAVRSCRVCGCIETRACVDSRGPCWWIGPDLCSHCAPVTIVSGLGRCGSSLVMSMLAAAGVPTLGAAPDFEDDACLKREISAELLQKHRGGAVKILVPHHHTWAAGLEARVITLRRDWTQQARSILKFGHIMADGPAPNRADVRKIIPSLERDEALAAHEWNKRNIPVTTISFELLIRDPVSAAIQIAKATDLPAEAVPLMVAKVQQRPSECLPDMAIELAAIAAAAAAR